MRTALRALVIAAVLAAGSAAPAAGGQEVADPTIPVVFDLEPSQLEPTQLEAGVVPVPIDGAGTEIVIGPDTRKKVKDTTKNVPRKVVQLLILFENLPSDIFLCTGFMIAPSRVATAGHCVFDHDLGGGAVQSVLAVPGRKGSTWPYGSCGGIAAAATTAWTTSGDLAFDAGFVELGCDVGDVTGVFKLKKWTGAATGVTVKSNGYPGDRGGGSRQFRAKGSVTLVTESQLFYDIDTSGGQSGSPVHSNKQFGCTCAVAIHSAGAPFPPYNAGVRITPGIKTFLHDTTV